MDGSRCLACPGRRRPPPSKVRFRRQAIEAALVALIGYRTSA
ncbi:MAG TPA: hypothetical protein VFQ44_14300 [Streptosporangiaceae bacterium]|nr:hypothetical protein [Streptosporangiaceae bacterium]